MYWETMDEMISQSQFAKYDFVMNAVAGALSAMNFVAGEKVSSLASRIEKILTENLGKSQQYNIH